MKSRFRSLPSPALRLHRDQGGQISFLTVFGAVALVALLGMVMTTGEQATYKIRLQNATDAAALSGASWVARGLNVTSASNVAQSQLVAAAIVLQSLEDTLIWSRPIVSAQNTFFTTCSGFLVSSWICGPAALATAAQLNIIAGLLRSDLFDLLAECDDGLFWRTAEILSGLDRFVRASFFGVAFFEAGRVGRANGAEYAALLPGRAFHASLSLDQVFLPTRKGRLPDLCDPMTVGSPEPRRRGYAMLLGYPVGKGPFLLGRCRMGWLSAGATGVPPVGPFMLPTFANIRKARLCGDDPESPPVSDGRRPARDLDECRSLDGEARWRVASIGSDPVTESDGCDWLATGNREGNSDGAISSASGPAREETLSCREEPPGERLTDGIHCEPVSTERTENGGYVHELRIWTYTAGFVDGSEPPEPPSSSGGSCSGADVAPYLLRAEQDAFRFLVLSGRGGWKNEEERNLREHPDRPYLRMSALLEDPPPLVAYAQVEVYNGLSHDAFTQDWRVRLERADLLERPLRSFDESAFGNAMHRLLSAAGQSPIELRNTLSEINNH